MVKRLSNQKPKRTGPSDRNILRIICKLLKMACSFLFLGSDAKSSTKLHKYNEIRSDKWEFPEWYNLGIVIKAWWVHFDTTYYKSICGEYFLSFYCLERDQRWYHKLNRWIIRLLSPTRAFADFLKHVIPVCELVIPPRPVDREEAYRLWKSRVLRAMNMGYRILSIFIFFAIYLIFLLADIYKHDMSSSCFKAFLAIVAYYCISRANEVFYAFIGDALRIAKGAPPTSALNKADRIKLALWSYVSLLFDFAILYWICRAGFIKEMGQDENGIFSLFQLQQLHSIWDALYFSGVTMATLGYGDINPTHPITKFLVLYQVACGISLLVLSFAIYLGDSDTGQRGKAPCKYPGRNLRYKTKVRMRWRK